MAETTGISWADRTWSPWIGCTRVSPACEGCYAAHLMETRMGRVAWGGPGAGEGTRDRTSAAYWRKPLAWNREAAASGERPFVFPSLCDPFDSAVVRAWRRDFFDLIRATPHLVWLLLTKRPGQIVRLFIEAHGDASAAEVAEPSSLWPANAWLGATFANQEELNRDGPKLLVAKARLRARVAFASFEPLLSWVDATSVQALGWARGQALNMLNGEGNPSLAFAPHSEALGQKLDWVIAGGETDQGGHKARVSHPDWFGDLELQCAEAGVPFQFKQWGEYAPLNPGAGGPEPVLVESRLGGARAAMQRWGSRRTGRTLNGRTYDARPQVAA